MSRARKKAVCTKGTVEDLRRQLILEIHDLLEDPNVPEQIKESLLADEAVQKMVLGKVSEEQTMRERRC